MTTSMPSSDVRTNFKDDEEGTQMIGGCGAEQFLMLIQTTEGRRQVTKEDFFLHEAAMTSIAQMKIEMFNE